MKITLTGSLGNISKPMAEILIKAGHDLTIISSEPDMKAKIEALGARGAIGSVADITFLTNTFKDADAVYTMVPYNFKVTTSYRQYVAGIGNNYATAIKATGVNRVVNLSSIGAHLENGTGPITGLHDVEQILNRLDNVAVKHLRPAIFYINFYFDIPLIKRQNIMGNNYSKDARLVMTHPRDVAAVAASELQQSFPGKSYRYIASDEQRISDIVKILGRAIEKPKLPWVQYTDEQTFAGMTMSGIMPPTIANLYVELGTAIDRGILWEDYDRNKPESLGNTKLVDFAKEFAAVYNN
ncbi:MAG TPA: NAD(P)H-binding protein [Puia sp.]|nr:NAD(P)H-binding protein [Puia sp.]